jgi:intracellular sulfur oxidation DsrE/DsrF family protein
MNNIHKKLFAGILLLLFSLQLQASNDKDNLLFMLRKMQHLKAATQTVKQIKSGDSQLDAGNIVVILCGKVVQEIPQQTELLKAAKAQGIQVLACGLSLKKFGVDPASLPSEISYVENGFIKAFELQKEGYLSVEL